MSTRLPYRRAFFYVTILSLIFTLPCIRAYAGPAGNSELFVKANMTEMTLKGLHVWLGKPVQVTAQLGYTMSWPESKRPPAWAFIHLTPTLAKFPNGNLIVTYTMDPDWYCTPILISAFQISKDGGEHWGPRYSVLMQHIRMIFVPEAHDSLMAIPPELFESIPGDDHDFRGTYYRFEQGGDRLVMQFDGVHILNWPWPVRVYPCREPRQNWRTAIFFDGDRALKIGGELRTVGSFQKKGDTLWSSVVYDSKDGGHTWRYFSTVAGPDRSLASRKRYEGPNEPSIIRLADGELMCVFRVGSGLPWMLERSYSRDEGRTWSKPDKLPAWSVKPSMVRTANGTLLLSTGRPGMRLWLSTDPRARNWQSINIVAYHNHWAPDPSYRIGSFKTSKGKTRWQTSSYTQLVEVAPNRLLMVYDRDPERAPQSSIDLSRVFVLPIEVTRN